MVLIVFNRRRFSNFFVVGRKVYSYDFIFTISLSRPNAIFIHFISHTCTQWKWYEYFCVFPFVKSLELARALSLSFSLSLASTFIPLFCCIFARSGNIFENIWMCGACNGSFFPSFASPMCLCFSNFFFEKKILRVFFFGARRKSNQTVPFY